MSQRPAPDRGRVAETASAITVRWTVTGTVGSSLDQTGLFGSPVGFLGGQAFTLTYLFDTVLGVRAANPQAGGDTVVGGSISGNTSPTLPAQLKIAGHTQTISATYFSRYGVCADAAVNCNLGASVASTVEDSADTSSSLTASFINITANASVGAIPANLDAPFVLSNVADFGNFQFSTYNYATQSYDVWTHGNLAVNSVSAQVVGAAPVPLPAAGLALIAGLGGLGLVRRRRRVAG